jgi:2-keto-4-pentenoate hydratase
LGVDQPDTGVVFDEHAFTSGVSLSRKGLRMIAPRLEAELAFVLERELRGPGVTIPQVLGATAGVVAVYEVLDSRIADWRIKIEDTIADNASGFGTVMGQCLVSVRDIDMTTVGLVLERDGEPLAMSASAAVFGHPARSVAWLAETLAAQDESLMPWEIVLTGSFTAAIDATPGRYWARFGDGIGGVEVVIED